MLSHSGQLERIIHQSQFLQSEKIILQQVKIYHDHHT